MSASYKKIDYRLRVAKSVERRLICTLLQQLGIFHPLKDFQYIGFGSVSFLDFSLFHKALGINKMISIEREERDRLRFEFNKPFNCIELKFGESSDILPSLDIEKQCILWLDYEDKLSTSILDDITLVFNRLNSGSIFCISFNAQQDAETKEKTRYTQLTDRLDSTYFPRYLNSETNLNKTGLRKVGYDIIQMLINDVLEKRKLNGNEIFAQQLLFINYNDGAEMNTLCWIFYDKNDTEKVNLLKNEEISFIREGSDPFEIKVPLLTPKEMKEIETKFPNLDLCLETYTNNSQIGFLPPLDIKNYFYLYKNFHLFAEIQL